MGLTAIVDLALPYREGNRSASAGAVAVQWCSLGRYWREEFFAGCALSDSKVVFSVRLTGALPSSACSMWAPMPTLFLELVRVRATWAFECALRLSFSWREKATGVVLEFAATFTDERIIFACSVP